MSESQSMQQRIFSELVGDRFEPESCPVLEPNSSPIVIHGSDSESDENILETKIDQSLMTTFPDGFPGPSSSYIDSKDQAVPLGNTTQQSKSKMLQASTTSVDEISLFVDDDDDCFELSGSRGDFGGSKDDRGTVGSGSGSSSKGKGKLGSSKLKHKSLQHSHKSAHKERHHSPRGKSKHQKRRCRSRDSSLEEVEEDRHEKNHRRTCKGTSRDEEYKYAKKRKARSSSGDRSRDSDSRCGKKHKERHTRHKKHHKRRSRSFSDSEEESCKRTGGHSSHSNIQRHKDSTYGADRGAGSSGSERRSEHNEARTYTDDGIEEQLIQEAKAIDEEIKASKREILKSALKKERIKLLQKNMRMSDGSGVGVASRTAENVEQMVLQDELAQLNEKLVSEKRRLLKVVKHIEEEKAEQID